jgi:large-conductance mechanosensitive channel
MDSTLKNNDSFGKFLYSDSLLQLIIAVYLGTVLQEFFNSFVNGFVMPLMILFVPNSKYNSFDDIQIEMLGVKIAIGNIIVNLIKMLIGFSITYYFVTNVVYKYISI